MCPTFSIIIINEWLNYVTVLYNLYIMHYLFIFLMWIYYVLIILQAAGKYRQQGRNYIVEDGDIIFFKFNAPNAPKKKWHQNSLFVYITDCACYPTRPIPSCPPLFFFFVSLLAWHPPPHSHFLFPRPVESNPPSVPKHRFSKLWQLCYLRSGSAPTPNCSSIWRSILLSRYFINLHHGCQHWHSWQRGQCHLLLSPFSR